MAPAFSSRSNFRYTTLKTLGLMSISIMSAEAGVRETWRCCDAVCFDVDSTVIQEEGIDDLAAYLGKGDQVAELTKEAMKGAMTFQEALKQRLDIIRPSQQQITEFIRSYPSTLTPKIKDLIDILHSRNVPVYLVSGGFHSLIQPVAERIGIPVENIFANKLKFYFDGTYAGFDEAQLTSRSGGKGRVIKILKEKHNYTKVIMIGDGATDMEAAPPADGFIGFGGNVQRDEVKKKAQWYVTNFQELIDHLSLPTK